MHECYLSRDRIGDTGVRYIMEGTSGLKLQELNLTNCTRVGDVAIVNILKRSVVSAELFIDIFRLISTAW